MGGLLHGGQRAPAGLLESHVACVSWFHREEFDAGFPGCRVVSNPMFVVDGDRLTCGGGVSVVHRAAWLIERHIGRASAVKALRTMIEEQPLPSRRLQAEAVLSVRSRDDLVHKAFGATPRVVRGGGGRSLPD